MHLYYFYHHLLPLSPLSLGGRRVDGADDRGHVVCGLKKNTKKSKNISINLMYFKKNNMIGPKTKKTEHVALTCGIAKIFMGFHFIDIHEPCGKT